MRSTAGCSLPGRRAEPARRRRRPRQRGVALITVLLIVALLTAAAVRLGFSSRLWVQQSENSIRLLQATQAGRAAQDWVNIILRRDNNGYDAYTDPWARPLAPIPIGPGFVQGYMEDMQARFNLNNLADGDGAADAVAGRRFKRLLSILDLPPGLAEAVTDWVDSDPRANGAWGAEDGYYLGMNPPYLAANRPFEDTAELKLVRGIDQAAWERLRPFVAALPQRGTAVNVNTASPEVLAAVITEWGTPQEAYGKARKWAEKNRRAPFRNIGGFYAAALDGGEKPAGLGVKSQFFQVHAQVEMEGVSRRTATLYQRDKQRVIIISHEREFPQ